MEKGKNFSLQDAAELIRRSFPEYSRLADMFTNCMRDTLEKTIRIRTDGSVFVITGDIPAMGLRESACQMW